MIPDASVFRTLCTESRSGSSKGGGGSADRVSVAHDLVVELVECSESWRSTRMQTIAFLPSYGPRAGNCS